MYSRKKEDDAERKLESVGFRLEEDTSRRTVHQGDRLMRNEDNGALILVDNKSTQSSKAFRLEKKDHLDKLRREAILASDRKGQLVIPVLTVSFFDSPKQYAIIDINDLDYFMWGKAILERK